MYISCAAGGPVASALILAHALTLGHSNLYLLRSRRVGGALILAHALTARRAGRWRRHSSLPILSLSITLRIGSTVSSQSACISTGYVRRVHSILTDYVHRVRSPHGFIDTIRMARQ